MLRRRLGQVHILQYRVVVDAGALEQGQTPLRPFPLDDRLATKGPFLLVEIRRLLGGPFHLRVAVAAAAET